MAYTIQVVADITELNSISTINYNYDLNMYMYMYVHAGLYWMPIYIVHVHNIRVGRPYGYYQQ